ncbi:MAG TPA: glutamate racemase [Myxococcales bacterium]|jgi:glutamate racemase|nr:glutamate racemase [Myxococcales bacterium]
MNQRSIGVFDSGVGGLTVLKALMRRLPAESTVYLGDTARVPYGTKSPEVVIRYSLSNARLLMRQQIKLLVVACNTASSVSLPALAKELEVPVLGVIEPGAQAAVQVTAGRVGVIGTLGTVNSGAYQQALAQARGGLEVMARACPLFVPLAEEGWTEGEVVEAVARKYLADFEAFGADTLVLGCTHYPLLKGAIARVVGPQVRLVDSAEATAEAAEGLLRDGGLLACAGAIAEHRYFVTDLPERFAEVGARFLERPIERAELVDL